MAIKSIDKVTFRERIDICIKVLFPISAAARHIFEIDMAFLDSLYAYPEHAGAFFQLLQSKGKRQAILRTLRVIHRCPELLIGLQHLQVVSNDKDATEAIETDFFADNER